MKIAPFLLLLGSTLQAAPPPSPVDIVGEPELVAPGVISTAKPEIRIAFSPDGKRRMWGTIGWEGGAGSWDLWEQVKDAAGWSAPRPVSFNSPQKDFDPSYAPDGSGVYFFSNRPGGFGGDDLYFAPWHVETGVYGAPGVYGTPINLGENVNSKGDEWAPVVSADGTRLLFASDGRGGKGLHDLFVSERVKGAWGKAKAVAGLNSAVEDFDATWLHDGKTIVFTRQQVKDSEEMSLYVSTWAGGRYTEPVPLDAVNVEKGMSLGPSIDPGEPGVLYFTSYRAAQTRGMLDVYRVRYRVSP